MRGQMPIGLQLTRNAKDIGAAFNDALVDVGGSLPVWIVLVSLKNRRLGNQRELARAVGIQGATLTHHLNAMERDGLITRRRAPDNRRIQLVELTEQGEALFHRLHTAAVDFDHRLCVGIADDELATFASVLSRLHSNVSETSRTG